MIKKYYSVVKKFFTLEATDKKLLFYLFITAFFRNIALILIPFIASRIIYFATEKEYWMTILHALGFLVCGFAYVLFHHYNYEAYEKNAIYTHNALQEKILDKVTKYDENFSKSISVPYIVNTAFNDVGKVMQIPDCFFDSITELMNVLIAAIVLILVQPYVGLFILVLIIISLSLLTYCMNKVEYYLEGQRKHQDSISGLMGQVIDGNKEIKSFNMKEELNTYLESYKKSWRKDYFLKRKYDDYACVLVPCILGIGKIIIYAVFIYFILHGKYDVATLVLVLGYFENIENEGEKLYYNIEEILYNSTRVNRVHKILNYKTRNMLTFGNNTNNLIKGKIDFQHVSFTYEKQQIMKNVSFSIEPRSFTAIVGHSGSGKSTIFRLLLRLYKANKGKILIDGEDIYSYTQEVYTSNVSIVTQKPFIFDMSIRENFNLVDSNHENQMEACKKAGIHDYIMSLPDGYNTKLVSDAENVSVGEKQLLALARTLLSKSEVLLFDEVTSALDMNTSKKIMSILKELKKDHTIIMITHKPALMKLADDILVIDKGKVVGRGTHKELIKKNKQYQLLHK